MIHCSIIGVFKFYLFLEHLVGKLCVYINIRLVACDVERIENIWQISTLTECTLVNFWQFCPTAVSVFLFFCNFGRFQHANVLFYNREINKQ